MSENQVTLVGNLGNDPELRYTPNGAAVTTLSVAVQNRRKTADGTWEDAPPTWIEVKAWRQLAENVAESLRKGSRVVVVGRLTVESWETPEGERRSKTVLLAEDIGPSLRWATASVTRQGGSRPGRSADEP